MGASYDGDTAMLTASVRFGGGGGRGERPRVVFLPFRNLDPGRVFTKREMASAAVKELFKHGVTYALTH